MCVAGHGMYYMILYEIYRSISPAACKSLCIIVHQCSGNVLVQV